MTIHLHPDQPRQIIEDFGASGCWTMDPVGAAWPEAEKRQVADLLFDRTKGIGLSAWRFNIGAGSAGVEADRAAVSHAWRAVGCFRDRADGPWDWSRHAGQQWFLRAARERSVEHLVAFANSPPVYLTRNNRAMCDPDGGSTNLRPGAEALFSVFLAGVLRHFAEEGLPFDTLSPINEPCWDWQGGQEGCRYANDDIARLLPAVRQALEEADLGNVALDAPDTGDIRLLLDDDHYRAYAALHARSDGGKGGDAPSEHARMGIESRFPGRCRQVAQALLGAEGTNVISRSLSGHSYWTGDSATDLVALRRLLRRTIDRYALDGIYRMTEFCRMQRGRDLGMDAALYLARVVHHDLVEAEASSWHWWLALSPHDYGDGLIYTDWDADGTGPFNVLPSKTLWALGNWSRFVRPGARRLAVSRHSPAGSDADLLVSAFATPPDGTGVGTSLVCVLINRAGGVSRPVRLAGFIHPGFWEAWETSETRDLESNPALIRTGENDRDTLRVMLPPRSVVTLRCSTACRAPSGGHC